MDTNVPAKLTAGDSWAWTRSLPDYPAGTWTLTYSFKNADGAVDSVVATASGNDYAIAVDAATSAVAVPGIYTWFAIITSGLERKTVESGRVEILADPSAAGSLDSRSMALKTLEALDAALLGRASRDQMAMSLNGRSISRIPIPELKQWRDSLLAEVKAEDAAATKGAGRNIKVRFGRG